MVSEPTANAPSVRPPDVGDHADAGLGTQVTLREASGDADAYYLTRLWHHYFGVEYNHDGDRRLPAFPARIAGWVDEDDVYGVIASHSPPDRDGTVPVGAGLVALRDHDEAVAEMPDDCRFDRDALVDDMAAYLVFGVVDPAFRGHGIGYEMFHDRLEWAARNGAEMVFSFGWERRDDARSSRPLFEAFDFVPIERFPDYYAENRGACPDCGSWPSNERACECAMTFWARDLPAGGGIT